MKRTAIYISLAVLLFATSYEASAQTAASSTSGQSNTERSLQELVKEVRQLRTEVRRLGLVAYKAQVLVERLRVQQAEVVRLSRDLSEIREKIVEAKARQDRLKESIKWAEKQVETGVASGKELTEMKVELEDSTQSEKRLIERETQLISDLQEARAKLLDLEQQLNAVGLEVTGK